MADGTRKAGPGAAGVKTCRWHVFRPWESPRISRRIHKDVDDDPNITTQASATLFFYGMGGGLFGKLQNIAMGRGTVLDYVKPEARAVVDDLTELDNEEYEL